MKEIKQVAFQGDVMIRRVSEVPEGAKREQVVAHGGFVVAHSETGHHHVAVGAKEHWTDGRMSQYLVANGDVDVIHHREHDTHEPLRLLYDCPPGGNVVWEITRQRESTPEGWRRVED